MVVSFKDAVKLFGVMIMCAATVFVCSLFLNYNLDMMKIKDLILDSSTMEYYDNAIQFGKAISALVGSVLLLTTTVMLFFYIKHYIDIHKPELGVLKAIGYSNIKIARSFWSFGFSVFIGTTLGFAASFIIMPVFYNNMGDEGVLPSISVQFNPILVLVLILIPSISFSLLSVIYSCNKLKRPSLELINGSNKEVYSKRKNKNNTDVPFLKELKNSTIRSRYLLVFFIVFSSLCYASVSQMSLTITDISSEMMSITVLIVGLVLAFTTLFLAITTVVKQNTKSIAMLKVFGYTYLECKRAILNGYTPIAYIGFLIGTVYNYFLMKMLVSVFYDQDVVEIPMFEFDIPAFFISLFSFIIVYEIVTRGYAARIKKISLKEIMLSE